MLVYDIIIVGAGPAGLYLASELANTNLKILILDKKIMQQMFNIIHLVV